MANDERIVRFSAEEMRLELEKAKALTRPEPTDEEIERAVRDDPDEDLSDDWSDVMITVPRNKAGVYIRFDPEVLEYFREGGPGYQTRINAVLRAYVDAQTKRKRAG